MDNSAQANFILLVLAVKTTLLIWAPKLGLFLDKK